MHSQAKKKCWSGKFDNLAFSLFYHDVTHLLSFANDLYSSQGMRQKPQLILPNAQVCYAKGIQ